MFSGTQKLHPLVLSVFFFVFSLAAAYTRHTQRDFVMTDRSSHARGVVLVGTSLACKISIVEDMQLSGELTFLCLVFRDGPGGFCRYWSVPGDSKILLYCLTNFEIPNLLALRFAKRCRTHLARNTVSVESQDTNTPISVKEFTYRNHRGCKIRLKCIDT